MDGSTSNIFICPICGKDCHTSSALADHVIDMHSTSRRKCVCPICFHRSGDPTLYHLASHMDMCHLFNVIELLEDNENGAGGEGIGERNEEDKVTNDEVNLIMGGNDENNLEDLLVQEGEEGGENSNEINSTLLTSMGQGDDDIDVGVGVNESDISPISQLMDMGFRREWCALALRETHNDVEYASTWIVDNLDFLGSMGTGEAFAEEFGEGGDDMYDVDDVNGMRMEVSEMIYRRDVRRDVSVLRKLTKNAVVENAMVACRSTITTTTTI